MIPFVGRHVLSDIYKACIFTLLFLLTADLFAQPGNSLHFDGSNDRVEMNDANSLDLAGAYTIECWIKPEAFDFLDGIVTKYHTGGSNGFTLRLRQTSPYTGLDFNGNQTAGGILESGKWYHVAAVSPGSGVLPKIYVNGVEQTVTASGAHTVVANTDKMMIGVDYLPSPRYFQGNIDEVRLWNVAKTQAEIQASMNIPVSPSSTGLVAYYTFNTGTAGGTNTGLTTLSDQTSNANNGTLNNFALSGSTSNWVESFAMSPPVISSFSPVSGAAGSSVTITGTGFNATTTNNIVYFGGMQATVTAASLTSLTVTVPYGAAFDRISILNTGNKLTGYSKQYFLPTFSPGKSNLIKADLVQSAGLPGSPISQSQRIHEIYSMVSGDFNNDGKRDIAESSGDSSIAVRANNTASAGGLITLANPISFKSSLIALGYNWYNRLSVGDLDADGKLDIVVPALHRPTPTSSLDDNRALFVLKNNGGATISSSSFSLSSAFTAVQGILTTAVADMDGDGKTDVISANPYSAGSLGGLSVFRNTSTGPGNINFAAKQDFSVGDRAYFVITADLDGDGKPEMIATRSTINILKIFQNTSSPGSLSFTALSDITTLDQPEDVTAGDIDGDGKIDLVLGHNGTSSTSFSVFRNTSTAGSISFATRQDFNVGNLQDFVSLGDLNGDGKPDLFVSHGSKGVSPTYYVSVLNNTSTSGSISFDPKIEYTETTAFPKESIIADFNSDGKNDVASADFSTGNIYFYRNTLQFPPTITSFTPATSAAGASVTITGTNFNTTAVNNMVYFGGVKATVTAASASSLTVTVPTGASYAPITVLNSTATLSATSIQFFTPAFTPNKSTLATTDFTEQSLVSVPTDLYGLAAGDLTGDGKPELMVTSSTSDTLTVLTNTSSTGGAVSFGTTTKFKLSPNITGPRYISIADMDGNGWLDLVIPSFSQSKVGVYLNSGTGVVSTAITFAGKFKTDSVGVTGGGPSGIATGDLDGDGRPDIVTANNLISSVSVLRNTSTTTNAVSFATKQDYQISSGQALYDVALADMDNDGKLDIITSRDINSNPGKVVFLRNTSTLGSISFAAGVEIDGPKAPWGLVPGDLNNDGLTDLVAGAAGSGATEIFAYTKLSSGGALNNLSTTKLNVSVNNIAIGLADLNGDGKPDVVSGTRSQVPGFHTYIFPNTSSGGTTSFGTKLDMAYAAAPAVTGTPWHATVTDMNGDGKPDIVMGNQLGGSSPSKITIYRNTLIAPPVTQASNISISNLTGTSATLTWTNGSGAKRAVFVKADNTGTPAPVTGTDYTANATLGFGSQIGSTGWYCIFNGTGNTVGITGLSPSTTYRAMVVEYNDGGLTSTAQYQTNTATNNPRNFTASATITSIARTGSANVNSSSVNYTVSFGSTVSGLSTSNFSLTTSGITGASVSSLSGSGASYAVTVNTGSGNGTLRLNLANTAGMTQGLTNTLPFAGETYTIDKTTPSISPVAISSNNSNTERAKVGDLVTLSFTASESINTPVVTIAGNSVTPVSSGNTWTATYTMVSGDTEGTVPFSISSISDPGGNTVAAINTTTNSSSVIFDKTVPILNSVAVPANGTYGKNQNLDFVVNFSENIVITGTPYIPLTLNTGGTVQAAYATGSGTSALTFRYTIVDGNVDNDGITLGSSITLNGGTLKDASGNDSGTALNSVGSTSGIFVDFNALSVISIARKTPVSVITNSTSLVYTITFSQNVTGVDINDFIFTAATATGNIASVSQTSASIYDVTVNSVSGNGSARLDLKASGTGITGNTVITGGFTGGEAFTLDQSAPTLSPVAIVSNNSNTARAKVGDAITLTFTSNESITTPTVTIATHAVTASNTGGNNWTASYTMASSDTEGAIPFNISFADILGNNGIAVSATTNSSSVTFDKTAPSLSSAVIVSNNSSTAKATTGDLITLTFTSSESILTPSVSIAGHTTATASNSSGNNWTASYTMAAGDTEGTVSFSIAYTDISGNAGTTATATTNSSSVIFDRTKPTLSPVSIASNGSNTSAAKTGDVITLNFTSSESISTPAVSIATHTVTASNTSGNNWTASYTLMSSDTEGPVPFSVSFSDLTGNQGTTVTTTTNSTSVSVTRTNLELLSISTGTLSPAFAAGTTSYTLSLVNISSALVTPISADSTATVAVNGNVFTRGTSINILLNLGSNPVDIVVTSPDGITTKAYSLTITRLKADQNITFDVIQPKLLGDPDFDPGARASSELAVTYSSSNTAVATIVSSKIHIVGFGTAVITASQAGNTLNYNAAPDVTRTLSVTGGAPDNITFSQNTIYENQANGTQVGTFSSSSSDPNSTFTYTLVSGTGSTDNALFSINGDKLLIAGALDYEQKSSYSILVRSTTQYGFFRDKQFTITINDVNEAPDNISLALATLYENQSSGSEAGVLSSTSLELSASFTYSLVSGTGSTDNSLFTISGNKILTAAPLDFEQKSSYAIRIRSTTQYGFSFDKQFTITISDVNEAPTLAAVANQVICYATNTFNISLTATPGPETGQTTTLTVSTDKPTMFAQLSISGSTLSYRLNTGVTGVATITVTVKDNGGTANGGTDTFARTFTITVNALPVTSIVSDLGLDISKGFTARLTASGGVTYSWANAAGIISGQNTAILTVRPSVTTTYTVTVTNGSGCSSVQSITLNVLEDYVALNPTNILTPNGDGKNDLWVIKNIDMYPNNTVKVFDRAGRLIFSKRGYTNDWGGTLEGGILNEDTYYFIIDFGPGLGEKRGYISVVK